MVIIGCMLVAGAAVNKKKLTHEYYSEKISEYRILLQEAQKKKLGRKAAALNKEQGFDTARSGYDTNRGLLAQDTGRANTTNLGDRSNVYRSESALTRAEKSKSFKQKGAGTFEDLLYDFNGFQSGLRPSQLDDLWQLMDDNSDGVHQNNES